MGIKVRKGFLKPILQEFVWRLTGRRSFMPVRSGARQGLDTNPVPHGHPKNDAAPCGKHLRDTRGTPESVHPVYRVYRAGVFRTERHHFSDARAEQGSCRAPDEHWTGRA